MLPKCEALFLQSFSQKSLRLHQAAAVFLTPWMLHESLSWLALKGKTEQCVAIIHSIAETNGTKMSREVIDSFKVSPGHCSKILCALLKCTFDVQRLADRMKGKGDGGSGAGVRQLFQTPRLRRHSLLMIASWVLITTLFDCHIRNISNLRYSIYVTFTLSAALELPADLLAIWGIDSLGRRWSSFISLSMSGMCMLACAFVMERSLMFVTVFSMAGRFFITYALNTGMQQVFEIFPTPLR